MGQSQATNAEGAADTVITNALIIDHWGIVKADIGIKDGRISGIGTAGNPDVQPDVDIIFGAGTEAIAGGDTIVPAGGVRSDDRRVGIEGVRTGRSEWAAYN